MPNSDAGDSVNEDSQQTEQTSKRVGQLAGQKLQDPKTDKATKSLAGSALAGRRGSKTKAQQGKAK